MLLAIGGCAAGPSGGGDADAAGASGPDGGAIDSVGWVEDIGLQDGAGPLEDAATGGADAAPDGTDASLSGDSADDSATTPDTTDAQQDVSDAHTADSGPPTDTSDAGSIVDASDSGSPADVALDAADAGDAGPDTGSVDDAGNDTGGVDGGPDDDSGGAVDVGGDATPTELCNNGIDDDGDGKADCADADCATACVEVCTDGKDNDQDGKVDCADSDCAPACVEVCSDGKDNDGDGHTDCADGDCKGTAACTEVCGDGKDNDQDGAADCDDADCTAAPTCLPPPVTCDAMYVCLIEQGCGCTLGIDCPADTSGCLNACFNDFPCAGGCLDELPEPMQANWNHWIDCTTTSCAELSGPDFVDCYLSSCLDQYASCFYAGASDCHAMYFECLPDCKGGDTPCEDACFSGLSAKGGKDLVLWNECRFGLCDANGDDVAESLECLAVASFFACADTAGSCLPPLTKAKSCALTTQCVFGCGGFGTSNQLCMTTCLGNMAASAAAPVSDLWTCAIAACGTTQQSLTIACVKAALTGACAAEASACGL